jgi:hypothetical protein
MANVAEAEGNVVVGTQQLRNCKSLQESGAEEKGLGGVGCTATTHPTKTQDCRKRPGGSSLRKVLICFPFNVCFILSVLVLGPGGLAGVGNSIVQPISITCVVNIKCAVLNYGFHDAKLVVKR